MYSWCAHWNLKKKSFWISPEAWRRPREARGGKGRLLLIRETGWRGTASLSCATSPACSGTTPVTVRTPMLYLKISSKHIFMSSVMITNTPKLFILFLNVSSTTNHYILFFIFIRSFNHLIVFLFFVSLSFVLLAEFETGILHLLGSSAYGLCLTWILDSGSLILVASLSRINTSG